MSDSLFFSSGQGISLNDVSTEGDSASGNVVEWTIFREGRFQHPWYGTLDFDVDFLEKMVENHRRNVLQRKVGFDAAHEPSNGAVSWIEDSASGLFLQQKTFQTNVGSKTRTFLMARHELTPKGKQLVEDKIYRYFSSEVDPNYSNGEIETLSTENGDVETVLEYGPTLIGGGIVMRPYIPNLGPVAFSDDGEMQPNDKDIALFKGQGEGDTGIFMFKDAVDSVISRNKTKKFFQFSAPKRTDEDTSEEDEPIELGNDAADGESETFAEIETPHSNEEDQGDKMKFTEVLKHVRGLDSEKAKINYLEEVQNQFADSEEAEIFSDFLGAKKEIAQARAEAEDAVQRKLQFQSQVEALEGEKIKMANDLREAREGSRQANVKQFSAELRENGHTEAVVKEIEEILTGLPSESYAQTFSVKSGKEDGDLNLTFKDMISRILAKLPKEATPAKPVEALDANQSFSAEDQTGANPGETAVDPDAGTQEFSEEDASDEDAIPANVLAFSEKQGYFPAETQWEWIDDQGVMHIGGIKQ